MSKYMGIAAGFTFTIEATATQYECDITIQVVDADGNAIEEVFNFELWLSAAPSGAGVTTVATITVAVESDGGVIMDVHSANAESILAQTNASGSFILSNTDTASSDKLVYAAARIPCGPNAGRVQVSRALLTADYGTA